MTPDDVKTAWETVESIGKAHEAALLAFQRVLADYRKAHPPPPGQYWAWYRGELRLLDSPSQCTHCHDGGFYCDAMPVVAWDDAGDAYCAEHRPKDPL